jgi:hypothetical protein
MWLATLFVGVFGGNIVGSNGTLVPVVVVIVPFAFVGTISIGRHGFRERDPGVELWAALEDETRARQDLAAEVAALRAKLP